MKDEGVSSVVGNMLMIIITIILAIGILVIGLYYAGVLTQEPFIGKLIPNEDNSNPYYVNATFIYTSPSAFKLSADEMVGFINFNGSTVAILFIPSENGSSYHFIANFTETGIRIMFNIVNPGGNQVNDTNLFIQDNSQFQFHSSSGINFNSVKILIQFKGYAGECQTYL